MTAENKLKHLEFIQSVINRMSGNSFLLKGWAVTLVAALFALGAKDANEKYIVVAYLPALVFWVMDGYFLSREKAFRSLYEVVRAKKEEDIDFSMNISSYCDGDNSWASAMFSATLRIFYLSLVGIMLLVMYLIR